jgi:YwiC-like protein
MSTIEASRPASERRMWRAVALPSEHGGWALTLEPIVLGLLVAWSVSGLALGIAAFAAFLVRTPLKLAVIDVRRHRWLPRSSLAARLAVAELLVMAGAVTVAVSQAGLAWATPTVIAAPLVAVEISFDVRSRGRRLLPELCGAIGIASVAASIVIAGGRNGGLAAGLWLILAARAVGAIPFVRVQILRLRRGVGPVWQSDVSQAASVAVAAIAVASDRRLVVAAVCIVMLACVQSIWVRRDPIPAKRLGLRQMAMGLALVAATVIGVWL